jgi:D-aminopeptidase
VLVESNYGGGLQMGGAPVGIELGQYAFKNAVALNDAPMRGELAQWKRDPAGDRGDGSVIVVIATDAPLSDRNLRRLASRAMMGIGRTGSSASNGSGDYAIAFSTSPQVRRTFGAERLQTTELANDQTTALFQAGVDAVEEAIYNSLLMATSESGNGITVQAIPLDKLRVVLRRHGIVPPAK